MRNVAQSGSSMPIEFRLWFNELLIEKIRKFKPPSAILSWVILKLKAVENNQFAVPLLR